MTVILYLIGKPGTGKYTIAKQLEKSDFIICDNQLINAPISVLCNYKGLAGISKSGWDAIGKIRKIIFDFISEEHNHNYVLTNCLYEDDIGDYNCYSQVEKMATKRNSLFVPVKLLISEEENLKRIVKVSRLNRWKSIDPNYALEKRELIKVNHPNYFELDVSKLSAKSAAKIILHHIESAKNN